MKGNLYLLTNKQNGMKYVGKTYKSIEDRFKEHIQESKKARSNNRDLYVAMRIYGVESFELTLIGTYEQGELENKEMEYIALYDTFANGYNQTLGGDGKRYVAMSDEDFINLYYELGTVSEVARKTGHDSGWISKILKDNNVEIAIQGMQPIVINENNMKFSDLCSCGLWLKENNYTKPNAKLRSVTGGIRRVLKGERKQYLGFTFTLLDNKEYRDTKWKRG